MIMATFFSPFNTPLEMQSYVAGYLAKLLAESFQYSIGDAKTVRSLRASTASGFFQYSIGDAHGAEEGG